VSMVDRIARLVLANINDLLDQAEDPEKMLNQILREMDAQRLQAREALAEMIAHEKMAEADWSRNERMAAGWGAKAEKAALSGRNDLARESLLRRRSSLQLAEVYESQSRAQGEAVSQMRAHLYALDAKYQRTVGQRDVLIARQRRAEAQATVGRSTAGWKLPNSESELQRMERRIHVQEARGAAVTELAFDSIDAQLLSIDVDFDIEQELARLNGAVPAPAALGATSTVA
jgi:phage shock protein A